MINIFCDGACSGNPGPGGWGAVIVYPTGHEVHLSGGSVQSTTNNLMEMRAATEALKSLSPGSTVCLTTDSEYVVKGMTQWIDGWVQRGWCKANGKPVRNQDAWKDLSSAASLHKSVSWAWIKGHAGHQMNELADQLAVAAIEKINAGETDFLGHAQFAPGESSDDVLNANAQGATVVNVAKGAMRVIRTDNYETENPVEYFVAQRLSLRQAQLVAKTLNDSQDGDGEDFYRVVDSEYQLKAPAN